MAIGDMAVGNTADRHNGGISPAEFERLRTWAADIAATLLPGVKFRDEHKDRRFIGQGGFSVNRGDGAWYSHAHKKGG
jgi:hypothetical protein